MNDNIVLTVERVAAMLNEWLFSFVYYKNGSVNDNN